MLKITNSLTGITEPFISVFKDKVNLYVCGITPYDFSHIGHGRCYVIFDLVYRYLTFVGYQVDYCRNFTDIDDKLLHKSVQEFGTPSQYHRIANRYIQAYHDDMQALNCISPNKEPKVTESIPSIIAFVQGLLDNGSAYELDGSVYFRVRKFANYGKLSKQDINDLCAGARINIDDKKEDALDFALWKFDNDASIAFESPWGLGRPGWHIECSAMAHDYFNGTVDIHGGGMDLQFPHHENEIAQYESLYPAPFVHYWMHNAFVRINKEKMSKSLNNFFTLKDILKDFDPMVLRFYFVKHYYRGPLDFSIQDLQVAEKTYKKIVNFFADVTDLQTIDLQKVKVNPTVIAMSNCLADDFNTSAMFGILFEQMENLQHDIIAKQSVKYFLINVVGLTLAPIAEKEVVITPEIQTLLDLRQQARAEKNWAQSDALRDQLAALGWQVQDKKI